MENRDLLYDIDYQTEQFNQITDITIDKFHEYTNYMYPHVTNYFLPFRGPPILALIFSPLANYPLDTAYSLFLYINVALIIWIIYLSTKLAKGKSKKTLIALIILASYQIYQTIGQGQPTLLLYLIILLTYLKGKKKQYFLAGVISSFLLLKTQFIILVPFVWAAFKFNKKYLLGALMGTAGMFIANVALYGDIKTYLQFVINTENPQFFSNANRLISIQGIAASFLNSNTLDPKPFIVSFVAFAGIYPYIISKTKELNLEATFSFSVLFGVLFSIHVFAHDTVIFLVPIVLLLIEIYKTKKYLGLIYILGMIICSHLSVSYLGSLYLIVIGLFFVNPKNIVQYCKTDVNQ